MSVTWYEGFTHHYVTYSTHIWVLCSIKTLKRVENPHLERSSLMKAHRTIFFALVELTTPLLSCFPINALISSLQSLHPTSMWTSIHCWAWLRPALLTKTIGLSLFCWATLIAYLLEGHWHTGCTWCPQLQGVSYPLSKSLYSYTQWWVVSPFGT